MSFIKAKPLPRVGGDPVTADELNHIDLNISRAIDGVQGGLYTPAHPIIVDSATIQLGFPGDTQRLKYTWRKANMQLPLHARFDSSAGWLETENFLTANALGCTTHWDLPWMPCCSDNELKAVYIWITPAGGHAALPEHMPMIMLYEFDPTAVPAGAVITTFGPYTDTSPTVGEYESFHAVYADISITPRADRAYTMYFRTELGADALAGTIVHGVTLFFKVRSQFEAT